MRAIASGAALWAVIFGLLALVQFASAAPVGVDGYYHLRLAQVMRQVGFVPDFPWLPLTILSPHAYYDHHFLYHVLLMPFAGGDPAGLALRGKLASTFIASLAFLGIWLGLRRHVPHAAGWTLGLFALSEAFLYRMSMPRTQSASLLLLALALFLLIERRGAWLLPLGFVYVWLYDAFPLLLGVAATGILADLLLERRLTLRPALYAAGGIALGLVFNPYFPRDIEFVVQHLLPKLAHPQIPVGNEWYPYDAWTLVTNSGLAYAAFAAGLYFLGRRGKLDRGTLMALLLAAAFGILFLRSRRFAEYFPPFSLIFLALTASPWLAGWLPAKVKLARALPALLAVPLAWTVIQARQSVAASPRLERYAAAATWLARHSQPGELVFQTDWDDFPRLFFYNTTNRYTLGLDPTYLQLADEALYDEWVAITRGEVDAPGRAIAARFGASFVFSDLEHEAFLERAEADPRLDEIYRDRMAIIFRVLPGGER
ncbi:MAG: hypothetical protein FJZ97_01305 [Chloroflexi bacterium]|nr:hypothetical protein [Chloroflexota bacterium]